MTTGARSTSFTTATQFHKIPMIISSAAGFQFIIRQNYITWPPPPPPPPPHHVLFFSAHSSLCSGLPDAICVRAGIFVVGSWVFSPVFSFSPSLAFNFRHQSSFYFRGFVLLYRVTHNYAGFKENNATNHDRSVTTNHKPSNNDKSWPFRNDKS